jgi:hypothetical protein
VAITSEEEKKNCCIDGPIIALLINLGCLHLVACVRSGDGGFYIRLRNVTSTTKHVAIHVVKLTYASDVA